MIKMVYDHDSAWNFVISSLAHAREVGQIAPHHALPEGSFGHRQVGHASRNEAAWPGVGVQREPDWNHQKHNDNP